MFSAEVQKHLFLATPVLAMRAGFYIGKVVCSINCKMNENVRSHTKSRQSKAGSKQYRNYSCETRADQRFTSVLEVS
eukprot:s571_g25.t1